MPKPTDLPRWADLAAPSDVVEPPSGKKDSGWLTAEEPAHSYFNWWMNVVYEWCDYLDGLTDEALTWTANHIFEGRVSIVSDYSAAGSLAISTQPGSTGNLVQITKSDGSGHALAVQNGTSSFQGNVTVNAALTVTGTSNWGETTITNSAGVPLTVTGDSTTPSRGALVLSNQDNFPSAKVAGEVFFGAQGFYGSNSQNLFVAYKDQGSTARWSMLSAVKACGLITTGGSASVSNIFGISGVSVTSTDVTVTTDAHFTSGAMFALATALDYSGGFHTVTMHAVTALTPGAIQMRVYDSAGAIINPSSVTGSFAIMIFGY